MKAVQKRHLSFQTRADIAGYLFISPFILGFLIWFMVPTAVAFWLIFQDWNLISTPRFIGLKNIIRLAKDPLFLKSLQVTAYYTLISVPLGMIIGFLVALLMNSKVRAISFFRTVFYLPSIVPAVANAMLWSFIFNSEYGLLNAMLRMMGFNKILWLQDPKVAVPALILMSLWGVGGGMVIYIAGLQGIPVALYEAAEIDGADRLSQLWHVTIPLMSPIIFFNLIIGIIGSFQVFSAGYLITNGGPQNATMFYVLYNYKTAFQYLDMGYASVLAWVLFLIILILTMVVFKFVGKMVYYEDVGS